MSIYSKEFGRADFTDVGVSRVLGTVPTGKVWVVKDLSAVGLNSGTLGARVDYLIAGTATPFWASVPLTTNAFSGITGRQVVLPAGADLRVTGHTLTGSGRLFVRAGGYELDA